jgi:hypothetical protein
MYAGLRTGSANKYWAYGQMLRPLNFESPRILMDWFHYNHGKETKEYNDSGEITVDAVVHSTWRYKDESIGLFFANVSEEQHKVTIQLDSEKFGMTKTNALLFAEERENAESLELSQTQSGETEFHIPAKSVVMIELS